MIRHIPGASWRQMEVNVPINSPSALYAGLVLNASVFEFYTSTFSGFQENEAVGFS